MKKIETTKVIQKEDKKKGIGGIERIIFEKENPTKVILKTLKRQSENRRGSDKDEKNLRIR